MKQNYFKNATFTTSVGSNMTDCSLPSSNHRGGTVQKWQQLRPLMCLCIFSMLQHDGIAATWSQKARFTDPDLSPNHYFSVGVDVAGGLALVGKYGHLGAPTGEAYLFDANTESTNFGERLATLAPRDPESSRNFGYHGVALTPGLALVGARVTGSAYLFDADPSSATFGGEILRLVPNQPSGDFGRSVDIDSRFAIVGAPQTDCCGAAYLFDSDPLSETFGDELLRFQGDNLFQHAEFGGNVALKNNRAIVAATNGSSSDAVYVFDIDPKSTSFGNPIAILRPDDPGAGYFGNYLAMDDNVAIVGRIFDDSAYVFDINPASATFGQQPLKLAASDGENDLGATVAVDQGIAMIGAQGTVYAVDVDPLSVGFGSTLVKLLPSDPATSGGFATEDIAMSGDAVIVGAFGAETDGMGHGAAYLFTRDESFVGDTNSDGVIDLSDLNNVRNNFDGTGLGDTDGNGTVDLADLNNVRNHFGESVAAINPVPEPHSWTLALASVIAFLVSVRLRNARN